jgi:hypothetical protein
MHRFIRTNIGLGWACTFFSAAASAQSPGWTAGFAHAAANIGTTEVCAFDAGSGERLYVASSDQFAPAAPQMIRRHDGKVWEPFHVDLDGRVLASKVWNDGTGSALYLAGEFGLIGGVAASRIARFDGTSFTPLGSGISGSVQSLAVHDDGSGPALYAIGLISAAGGNSVNGVARWNGSSWGGIASIPGLPYDAVSFDDGSGPALYVAGDFLGPNATAPNVAKWTGSSWVFLPFLETGSATALCVHDDGTGPALYAANMASSSLTQVVRWNGTFWTTLGPAFDKRVYDLETSNVGGAGLIAVGEFTTIGSASIKAAARWNGTQWSALSSTFTQSTCNPTAFSVANFAPAGSPAVVVVAGCFYGSMPGATYPPFEWDGIRVSSLFAGQGLNSHVHAQLVYDDGSGEALYAGGSFSRAGNLTANDVARWNGAMWSPVGNGLGSGVQALAAHDDGGGKELYAGGSFGVRRWNGSSWTEAGTGMGNGKIVAALAEYDAGSGAQLYAGYVTFDNQLGQYVDRVARWNGATWTDVGADFDGNVRALTVHDSGAGPELYAAGAFTQCGAAAVPHIARWDGGAWTSIGSGLDGTVECLLSADDGGGPALYAGGSFNVAGGVPALGIARWRNNVWSELGSGLGASVSALTFFDDGSGSALFAGGSFTVAAPGGNVNRIARWNGSTWSRLGAGIEGAGAEVRSLTSFQSDWTSTPKLSVGGFFGRAGGEISAHFAHWGQRNEGIAACFGDGLLANCPCNNSSPLGAGAGCLNSTGQGGRLRSSGEARVSADTFKLLGSQMTNTTFVIYFQGTAATAFGAGVPLDDGLGCASGNALRIATVQNQGGVSAVPNPQAPTSISVRGMLPPMGGTRVYQGRYRDVSGPCGTFVNRTNAVIVTWRP